MFYWIKQIQAFSSNPKNIKDSEVVYMILRAENPNLWGYICATVVIIGLKKKKDYVLGIYIHFLYRNTAGIAQRFLIK